MYSCLVCLILVIALFEVYNTEKIRFIAMEHPKVSFVNSKYVTYFNLTSRRFRRSDPFYYVDIRTYSLYPSHNNVTAHFYFYEFLTNRYRRGFVEMHFLLCDMVEKDTFFGTAFRSQRILKNGCPFPPGAYELNNMTVPLKSIPHNFPFRKGRIYCNMSKTDTNEQLLSMQVDMEIKEVRIKKQD